jgi:hypothetical protein
LHLSAHSTRYERYEGDNNMVDKFKNPWGIASLAYLVVFVIVFFASGGFVKLLPLPVEVNWFVIILWIVGAIPGVVLLAQKKYFPWFSSVVGGLGCVALLFVVCAWLATGPFLWLISVLLEPRKECPSCKRVISEEAVICAYCGSDAGSSQSKAKGGASANSSAPDWVKQERGQR